MPPETIICPHCASPCPECADFCAKCQSPLTTHATTDPMGSVFAAGFAAHKAVGQSSSRIVVTGVWMWMLPVALFSVFLVLFGIYGFLGMFVVRAQPVEFENVLGSLLSLGLGALFLYVSGSILYRSTRSFLENRARSSAPRPAAQAQASEHVSAAPITAPKDDDGETLTCLACGQRMAQNAAECPACGWSYHK